MEENVSGCYAQKPLKSIERIINASSRPDDVVIDFAEARVYDHSGLEAIDALAERYLKYNKKLHLRHLSQECHNLLDQAGDLVEVNRKEDPKYHVADDRLA